MQDDTPKEVTFIRPDENDTEFKFWPFKAKVFLNRVKQYPDIPPKPFSDYVLSYYKKYDEESYEIAINWNMNFTQKEIDRENKLDRKLRKEKEPDKDNNDKKK